MLEDAAKLLSGDLEKDGKKELQPYLSDIDRLKAGHHGSRWFSLEELLNITQPEIALIFVPENSVYGQSHQEILDRMEKAGAMIPATKDCGAVRLIPKKSGLKS